MRRVNALLILPITLALGAALACGGRRDSEDAGARSPADPEGACFAGFAWGERAAAIKTS